MSDSTSKSIKYTNVENEKIKVPPPLCPHTLENVLNWYVYNNCNYF